MKKRDLEPIIENYRGYLIRRYTIGRYVDRYNYRSGITCAPSKMQLKLVIDGFIEVGRYTDQLEPAPTI